MRAFLARRSGMAAAEAAPRRRPPVGTQPPRRRRRLRRRARGYLGSGGPDFDACLRTVVDDLGLPERALDRPTSTPRVGRGAPRFAAILLSRFDVLLLDEPTNDLDFDGLARLEHFLDGVDGGWWS